MKFTINQRILWGMVQAASAGLPRKAMLPVLNNFKVKAGPGNSLTLTASDLDVAFTMSTDAVTVEAAGEALVPGSRFSEIVHHAVGDEVEFHASKTMASIHSGKASWTLQLSKDSYPPDESPFTEWVEVDVDTFRTALAQSRHAASSEQFRQTLMMVDFRDERARAADGSRMVQAKAPGVPDTQIPVKSADFLLKSLKSEVSSLRLASSDTHLFFEVDGQRVQVQRLAASFPDVTQIMLIPAKASNTFLMQVDRDALKDVLKRVGVTAPKNSSVVLSLAKHGKFLTVASEDEHGNTAREQLPAIWSSTDREVSLHLSHLKDVLDVYPDPLCSMFFASAQGNVPPPVLFATEDESFMAVLNQVTY